MVKGGGAGHGAGRWERIYLEEGPEGLAIERRGRGSKGRPPKFDAEQLDHAMELLENHSYTQTAKLTGISKSTLIRERKRRYAE